MHWFLYRGMEGDPSAPLVSKHEEPLNIPEFDSIPAEKWIAGIDPIRKVVNCVSPTLDSDDKRNEVIEYMQKLIGSVQGVQVFAYGSVPLKTYLPEGDIDLTAISTLDKEQDLHDKVLSVLQAEAQNPVANFEIKNIKFINAEVKIMKCIVGGIMIDISFNQLGGLCSLCFLEQADRIIAREHLFKRSIILIKAWCSYESHIIGASFGLISTYALEILILYIFYMYNASLTSPLMVLYRFLAYYGDFDCDNLCISIDGPAKKSSLPNIVVDNPINSPLLGKYLRSYIDMFSVPSTNSKKKMLSFNRKYLNIIDPLKQNNNLGRSVNKRTFLRIRYALRHGARKLGEILELPIEDIPNAVKKFFMKTLKRHYRYRNIPMPMPTFSPLSSNPNSDVELEDESQLELWNADLDDHISKTEDVCKGELPKGIDLSTVKDPSLIPTNEEGDVNEDSVSNPDTESGGLLYSFGNLDAISEFGETEDEIFNLVNFAGDYDGNVRNLVYSQYCHGFPFSAAQVPAQVPVVHRTTPYSSDELHELALWYDYNVPYQYPCPYGPVVQSDPNVLVHGTGTFIPTMGQSMGGRGKECGSLFRPHVEIGCTSRANHVGSDPRGQRSPPSCGQSFQPHAATQVNPQRKLEFGSFGTLPETSSGVMDLLTSFLRPKTPQRNQGAPPHFEDENEFPPLSL